MRWVWMLPIAIRRAILLGAAAAMMLALPTSARPTDLTIAVVGDSLSVGLAEALIYSQPAIRVIGYGVVSSGLTNPRIVDWQKRIRDVASTRPTLVMVLIGMNDSASAPDSAYVRKLVEFLYPLQQQDIPFLMIAVPPTNQSSRNVNIEKLNAIFSAATPRLGGRFISLPSFPRDYRTADGIHFTRDGYLALADAVVAGFRQVLERNSLSRR